MANQSRSAGQAPRRAKGSLRSAFFREAKANLVQVRGWRRASRSWGFESKETHPPDDFLFAQRAGYLAATAAKWAADSLDLETDQPIGRDIVMRFMEEISVLLADTA